MYAKPLSIGHPMHSIGNRMRRIQVIESAQDAHTISSFKQFLDKHAADIARASNNKYFFLHGLLSAEDHPRSDRRSSKYAASAAVQLLKSGTPIDLRL